MRQAGRYLPEYRAVRERVDFLTLCKTPDLAAEVSLQPIDRFGMDACIIFSDILLPLEAMGARLEFSDKGPFLPDPVRDSSGIERLAVPDPEAGMPFMMDALRLVRERVRDRAALVGFVGAPFTLAAYLVEGGGSKNFAIIKSLMYNHPLQLHALLAKLAQTVGEYAAAQAAAGAQAVQVFDTWAGELDSCAYEQFAMPYQAAVIERIRQAGVPAILFVNGCAGKLASLVRTAADVLSVDWRIDLRDVRASVGDGFTLQGNVDPCVLLSNPEAVGEAARDCLVAGGPYAHILNLGHGILPATPIECAQAFVRAPRVSAIPV